MEDDGAAQAQSGPPSSSSNPHDTIEKFGVYDDRVVQYPVKFAVTKGAASINNMKFQAITNSSNQHTYMALVPSQATFVNRQLNWTGRVGLQFTFVDSEYTGVTVNDMTTGSGLPLLRPLSVLRKCFINSFPLHRLANNVTVTINTQNINFPCDILSEVLRLIDTKFDRERRYAPTQAERYGAYKPHWFVEAAPQMYRSLYPILDQPFTPSLSRVAPDRTGNNSHPYVQFLTPGGIPIESGITDMDTLFASMTPAAPPAAQTAPLSGTYFYTSPITAPKTDDPNETQEDVRAYIDSVFDPTAPSDVGVPRVIMMGGVLYGGGNTGAQHFTFTKVSTDKDAKRTIELGMCQAYPIFLTIKSTEHFICSPFIFNELAAHRTGLFGLGQVGISVQFANPSTTEHVGRIIRGLPTTSFPRLTGSGRPASLVGTNVSSVQDLKFFNPANSPTPWVEAYLDVIFMDPNWEVPVPPRNVVEYTDFQRYIWNFGVNTGAGDPNPDLWSEFAIQIPPTTLNYIPNLLLITVKPMSYKQTNGDFTFPLKKIQLQWANQSGMMTNFNSEQLWDMSVHNGVPQTYTEWIGHERDNLTTTHADIGYGSVSGDILGGDKLAGLNFISPTKKAGVGTTFSPSWLANYNQTIGPLLALRPGIDFRLDPGQAPGMVGNFLFTGTLTCFNNTGYALGGYNGGSQVSNNVRLCVIAVNSGFLASVYGTTALMRGIVSPEDVTAKGLVHTTMEGMHRLIGGGIGNGGANSDGKGGHYLDMLLAVLKHAGGIGQMISDVNEARRGRVAVKRSRYEAQEDKQAGAGMGRYTEGGYGAPMR